jgi:hypothetical protein
MQAGKVASGCLVVAGSDAAPGFQLVDQALDGVPVLVEIGVMGDGPAAPAASLLPVGGLVLLLRDDRLDPASAQVGAVGAGRVRLIGMCVGRLDRSAGARARRLGYTQRQECFDKTDAVQAPAMSTASSVSCARVMHDGLPDHVPRHRQVLQIDHDHIQALLVL